MWSEPSGHSETDSLTSLRTLPGAGRELRWISPGLLALETERVLWEAGRSYPLSSARRTLRTAAQRLNLPQVTYRLRHCYLCAVCSLCGPSTPAFLIHTRETHSTRLVEGSGVSWRWYLRALTRHVEGRVEGSCYHKVQLPREVSSGFSPGGLVLSSFLFVRQAVCLVFGAPALILTQPSHQPQEASGPLSLVPLDQSL